MALYYVTSGTGPVPEPYLSEGYVRLEYQPSITVDPGSTYVLAPDIDGNLDFGSPDPNSGATYPFTIRVGQSNSNLGDIDIANGENNTIPTLEIAAGVQIPNAKVWFDDAYSSTINIGDGARLASLRGSDELSSIGATGIDTVTIGDNVTIGADIDFGSGSDNVTIGDNFRTNDQLLMGSGDDTLTIGEDYYSGYANNLYSDIDLGSGNDLISIGSFDHSGPGYEEIFGGSGVDTVEFTALTAQEQSDLTNRITNPGGSIDYVDQGDGTYRNTDRNYGIGETQDRFAITSGSLDGLRFDDVEIIAPVCFVAGTLIETDRGALPIEELTAGDMVRTRDNGFQPIRWIGSRTLDGEELAASERLLPVRIRKSALGRGLPERDLLVSQQHRIVVRSKIVEREFGVGDALVAAKHLCAVDGIDIVGAGSVTYLHMLFDRHEIVFSEGAETESLYTGAQALANLSAEARAEIFEIFPELERGDYEAGSDYALASPKQAKRVAMRHDKNSKPLVA